MTLSRGASARLAAAAAHDAVLSDVGADVWRFDDLQRADIEWFLTAAAGGAWKNETSIDLSQLPPVEPVSPGERTRPRVLGFAVPAGVSAVNNESASSAMAQLRLCCTDRGHPLPMEGYLALSSRQAMRLLDILLPRYRRDAFVQLVALQHSLDRGAGDCLTWQSKLFCDMAESIEESAKGSTSSALPAAAKAIYALGRSIRCVWAQAPELANSFSHTAAV